jgi:hypothetical protein
MVAAELMMRWSLNEVSGLFYLYFHLAIDVLPVGPLVPP